MFILEDMKILSQTLVETGDKKLEHRRDFFVFHFFFFRDQG